MDQFAKETLPISLEEEMRRSYLDYAMSVIVGRALPDVRDGLKPVHRRILFAMHEANNVWNRPYVKCARVVGDVLGKYHPHGDSARPTKLWSAWPRISPCVTYSSTDKAISVRSMAIPRRPTGIPSAGWKKSSAELLADIDKETVDFVPNYDGKEQEPSVLPTRIPNLLINGSSGIAVGMATNVPPHNLSEIVSACLAILERPTSAWTNLSSSFPARIFRLAESSMALPVSRRATAPGAGGCVIRARTHVEELEKGNRQAIVIDELPYQVNKSSLLMKIGDLVREKRLDGLSEIRDESDKSGMRVVLELKRGEVPKSS